MPDGVIRLVLDDRLFHETGRKIVGSGRFRDVVGPTRRRRVGYARGLNLVVLTLRVNPPWGGEPLGRLVNVRGCRKGGLTCVEVAEAMIVEVVGWLPGPASSWAVTAGTPVWPAGICLAPRGLAVARDAAVYESRRRALADAAGHAKKAPGCPPRMRLPR